MSPPSFGLLKTQYKNPNLTSNLTVPLSMLPPILENSQESLKKEKPRAGRDKVEPRNTTDPDEPAGLMESVTGRHVAPESLQDSDPKTSSFLGELPDPCPPSGEKGTHLKDSLDRCSDSSPPGGGPTPPLWCSHSEIQTAPSTNSKKASKKQQRTKGQNNQKNNMWRLITKDCDPIIMTVKEVLNFINNNFNKPLLNRNRKYNGKVSDFTINNSNKPSIYTFLQLVKQNPQLFEPIRISLIKYKYRQLAFAILIKTNNEANNSSQHSSLNNEIEIIGPFFPNGKKHSEDLLIEELRKKKNISVVWIYTVNSPCLGRNYNCPKSYQSCLYNLINYAKIIKLK
ncbi:uncharacterized protein LOC113658477 [Tachysurus fulvidraco]|uniref:uncharacterized protein LOC113658477 n=1 Tax=Tachysurus fulvidraco TaxID=1234273 RepID=UPI001FF02F89|nr:uncharacterized protein LOC113658477 [Tachysurus fulvidraco]